MSRRKKWTKFDLVFSDLYYLIFSYCVYKETKVLINFSKALMNSSQKRKLSELTSKFQFDEIATKLAKLLLSKHGWPILSFCMSFVCR